MKLVQFAIRVNPDEAAHNELPHLDLHCLPLSSEFTIRYGLDETFFEFWTHKLLLSASLAL